MKKFLGLLTILATTMPLPLSVLACSCTSSSSPKPVAKYDSITDGLKALKVHSYCKVATGDLRKILKYISVDSLIGLFHLNFKDNVAVDFSKLSVKNVINSETNQPLTTADLTVTKDLTLQVTTTYDGTDVKLANTILTIANHTDLQISDFIKNYDYNDMFSKPLFQKFIQKLNHLLAIDVKATNFMAELQFGLPQFMGSYGQEFVIPSSFIINSLKKNGVTLTDNDFKVTDGSKISFTCNCQYASTPAQDMDLSVVLTKYDMSDLPVTMSDKTIMLESDQDPSSLTSDNVTKIVSQLKATLMLLINEAYSKKFTATLMLDTDIVITGFSEIVEGADFTNLEPVTYTISVADSSKYVTGAFIPRQSYVKVIVNQRF